MRKTLHPVFVAFGLAAASGAHAAPSTPRLADPEKASLESLARRVEQLELELARRPLDVSSYNLPDEVDLCGTPIRLDEPEVRERMERELYMILGDRAQVVLWTKRARRVFPAFEREIRSAKTCGDLKYLAVIESGLRASVTSHASASGYWQFMAPTARQYGLSVDDGWDSRADLEASTRAGVAYLRDLRAQFGDWSLAMAAYNTGPGRLRRAMESQGQQDYWRLDLIEEAERYVPRVIAAKIVLSNLRGYGFQMDVEDGWAAEPSTTVRLALPQGSELSVLDAARRTGIDLRTFRRLNPELVGSDLPSGRELALEVPVGKEDAVKRLGEGDGAAGPRGRVLSTRPGAEPRRTTTHGAAARKGPGHHVVRRGDSLGSIAARHGVSVEELRRLNKMGRKDVLRAGQRLVVRR